MKKLILIALVFATPAFGQEADPVRTKLEATIGKLVVENTALVVTVENLQKQIADLKKQLEEKDKK